MSINQVIIGLDNGMMPVLPPVIININDDLF